MRHTTKRKVETGVEGVGGRENPLEAQLEAGNDCVCVVPARVNL